LSQNPIIYFLIQHRQLLKQRNGGGRQIGKLDFFLTLVGFLHVTGKGKPYVPGNNRTIRIKILCKPYVVKPVQVGKSRVQYIFRAIAYDRRLFLIPSPAIRELPCLVVPDRFPVAEYHLSAFYR